MINRENPYGWGISGIPIARNLENRSTIGPGGRPVYDTGRDLPWRLLGACFFLAFLALTGIILLKRPVDRHVQTISPPVEVTVRLMEEPRPETVPEARQPAPAEPVRTEPSLQGPTQPEVARPTAAPEEPAPVIPPPSVVLDPPKEMRNERPDTPPVTVPEPVRVIEEVPQATLPVAPEPREYVREKPKEELPGKTAEVDRHTSVDLPAPQQVRETERSSAPATLPEASTVSVGNYSRAELPAPLSRISSGERTVSPPAAGPASLRTSRALGGGGSVALPASSGVSTAVDRSRRGEGDLPQEKMRIATLGQKVNLPAPGRTGQATPSDARGETRPSYERLEDLGTVALDPSVAMTLSRLRTCRDPEEELNLKSRLAARVADPVRCRSGGVVFDIRNAESAYSAHVDIYNYEGREFKDRCAALHLAIEACGARR